MSASSDAVSRRVFETLNRVPVVRRLMVVVLVVVAFVASGVEARRARRRTRAWAAVLLGECCGEAVPPQARSATGFACRAADLAGCSPVADVVAAGPRVFAGPHALDGATGRPETVTWEQLLDSISLGVQVRPDGRLAWWVAFDDDAFPVTNVDVDVLGEELVASILEAEPGMVSVDHVDREAYELVMSEPRRADVFLSRYLRAVVTAYRAAYPAPER